MFRLSFSRGFSRLLLALFSVLLAAGPATLLAGLVIAQPPTGVPCREAVGEVILDDPIFVTEVGVGASGVAVADLNQDGHVDFVAAATTQSRIKIKFGSGDGTFWGTHTWTMGDGPTDVDVADFNNDGYLDIIATNVHADKVRIRWGAATKPWSNYSSWTVGDNPWRLAVGDVNDDGRDDFVTVNLLSDDLTVRRRLAAGGFDTQTYSGGEAPTDVKLADMDGDGDLDLVYATGVHFSTVKYRKNNGSGVFGGVSSINMGSGHAENFHGLAIGDLNEDGKNDIVATRNTHSMVRVLASGGGYGAPVAAPTGNNPSQIYMEDFDQDGHLDLAMTHVLNSYVSIYLGGGNGNVSSPTTIEVSSHTYDLATGDFNEDEFPDMVVTAGDSAYLLLSQNPCDDGGGIILPPPPPPTRTVEFIRGDMNTDGKTNIADALFSLNWLFGDSEAPECLRTADVNGDDQTNIADATSLLNFLFGDGAEPPSPGPYKCGPDRASELSCASYSACPTIGFGGPGDIAQ